MNISPSYDLCTQSSTTMQSVSKEQDNDATVEHNIYTLVKQNTPIIQDIDKLLKLHDSTSVKQDIHNLSKYDSSIKQNTMYSIDQLNDILQLFINISKTVDTKETIGVNTSNNVITKEVIGTPQSEAIEEISNIEKSIKENGDTQQIAVKKEIVNTPQILVMKEPSKTTKSIDTKEDGDLPQNVVKKEIVGVSQTVKRLSNITKSIDFVCILCQRSFSTLQNMQRHRDHTCKNNPYRTPRPDSKKALDILNAVQQDVSAKTDKIADILKIVLERQNSIENMMSQSMIQIQGLIAENEKKISQLSYVSSNMSLPFDIKKIHVFITNDIDFTDILTKRLGNREKAINIIRSNLNKKVLGDVDLFCEIYLQGNPNTWSIRCLNKGQNIYQLIYPNNKIENDSNGNLIYKYFQKNYSNTLLRLNNSMIYKVVNTEPGSIEHTKNVNELYYDLKSFQDKAYEIYNTAPTQFIKMLSSAITTLEESYIN